MQRGELRVYLGAAPGAGKTYRMLDEGYRRRERGTDVVIGYVETHGRPQTEAQLRDLEIVPRLTRSYRGAQLEEMDVDKILARHPEVVLVDELAHTNVPGGAREKRWQDVEDLLDAGIDVITTVNIQHLESVNDVVEKITGVVQRETIPDAVVRRAAQLELVDITPEALRRRMAHGNIYTADKIDASLSNYFRSGNLTALRELALLWLADRVEDSLQSYLADHEITTHWETRERLVVAVTGRPSDEVLLRRAARISSRSGAELVAVHVAHGDGPATLESMLQTRELIRELDGTFQEIVDDDVAAALVSFARDQRGTQIVLGSTHVRRPWRNAGHVVTGVLRHAHDLDVHVIAVGETTSSRPVRRRVAAPHWTRTLVALAVMAAVMALLTVALTLVRSHVSTSTIFLVYLLVVVGLSIWSDLAIGLVAAVVAFSVENYYFVLPLHTFAVATPDDLVALVAYLAVAVGVSVTVSKFSQRTLEADRARAEATVLAQAAATVGATLDDLQPLLASVRTVFNLRGAAMYSRHDDEWHLDLTSGDVVDEASATARFMVDDDHLLVLDGRVLSLHERELVLSFAARLAAGLKAQRLQLEANELRAVAEVDALRTGLLRSVSHDLRTPLATIEANVSSLLERDVEWSAHDAKGFLEAIEREVRRLTRLVTNLLDAGRLEAKAVQVRHAPVDLADLVASALETIDTRRRTLDIDVPDDLATFLSDPDLLERVLANVLANACRFSPPDQPVRLVASGDAQHLEILIIDRGPGIALADRARVSEPFRRLNDESSGAGLGLAVATGFVELLGGELRFEDTPGGGLTVVITLSAAAT